MANPTAAGDLASVLIQELDEGVILVDDRMVICFATGPAVSILDGFGAAAATTLPAQLARALVHIQGLARHAYAPGLSPSIDLPVPGGSVYVRAKTVPRLGGWLLVLRSGRLRSGVLERILARDFGLSRRECELVTHVRAGLRNRDIADRMKVSVGTIKTYLSRVFVALDVQSRAALIARTSALSA